MVEVVDPVDPRLLLKAAGPGRVRGLGLEILAGVRAAPQGARSALSTGLRQARALHSRERRLVGDMIRAILRDEAVLDRVLGVASDPVRWLGELVDRGLDPAVAAQQAALEQIDGVPWERVVGDWRADAVEGLDAQVAVQVLGSFSAPIAARIVASLGGQSLDFVRASATRAAVQLRVRGDVSLASVVTSLAADGVAVSALRFATHGLQIDGRANLHATRAFKGGQIEVQDEGSQLLAELVDASGAERIVDVCAGAGGKTLALASAAPQAKILAMDVRARALSELQIRANRAGALRVKALKLPPTGNFPAQVRGWSADRVLVDAPCSGLGTLRRHPEQRMRLSEASLESLSGLQRQILGRSAKLVRPGGRLVYGTCSVLRSENDDVVEQFLATHPDFRQVSAAEVFGSERAEAIGVGEVMRLSPHTHGTDGFFGAVLERVV